MVASTAQFLLLRVVAATCLRVSPRHQRQVRHLYIYSLERLRRDPSAPFRPSRTFQN